MIVGYSTMNPKERNKYDVKRVGLLRAGSSLQRFTWDAEE
ncbi:MAG: DUF3784 domain-containing protein [Dysgonamonadaceae bacterium]|nr:DUF3784 domain-containing protein [Dysgonamonadaceae bacterium]